MNQIEMSDDFRKMFENLAKYGILRHDEDKPLYKYVSIDTAKKIIGDKTIKFSTPHELNDNDLDTSLLNPKVNREAKAKITIGLLKKHPNQNLVHYIENEMNTPNSKLLLTDEGFNAAIIQGYEEERKNVGIFCLTTNNTNDYMWEKYAENHRGVCIEFKFPCLFTSQFYTFTVSYDSKFDPETLFNDDLSVNSLAVNRWLCTKNKNYSIENEVRMIAEKHFGICSFPEQVLIGVYYGKRTSEEDIFELERLLEQGNYLFKKGKKLGF